MAPFEPELIINRKPNLSFILTYPHSCLSSSHISSSIFGFVASDSETATMPPKRRALTPLERHEICKRRLEPKNAKKTLIKFGKLFVILYLLSRYMRPEELWQRWWAFLNSRFSLALDRRNRSYSRAPNTLCKLFSDKQGGVFYSNRQENRRGF